MDGRGEAEREGDDSSPQMRMWNGVGGQNWVAAQAVLDRLFQPLEDLLVGAVADAGARDVLDIGCGTGATTIAIARRLGPGGHCTGIDISRPMLAAARRRAAAAGVAADFIRADAGVRAFAPGGYDMIVSRFGIMFFQDPARAFANLRHSAGKGAMLRGFAWRSPAENPFMTTSEAAARPLLPDLPARQPGAPGQFAFADAEKVRRILAESGWQEGEVRPVDVPMSMAEAELSFYISRLGPVGAFLQSADARTREKVISTVRPAFDPFVDGDRVRFTAACWQITARAP